jgi:hypothetical protein
MANTKKLTRDERKSAKRKARRALKEKWNTLAYKSRKEYRKAYKSDKKTFTVWLREKEAEASKPEAEQA